MAANTYKEVTICRFL